MRLPLILLFVASSFSSVSAQDAIREPVARGRVTDEGGGVLPGVTITANAPGWTIAVLTNHEGEFLLVGAPPGIQEFTVTASFAGFDSATRTVRATINDEVTAAIKSRSAPIVLDFVLRLACLTIVDYVHFEHLPDAMKSASDVVHIKVLSAVPWSRPPRCGTQRATEHAVMVLDVVKAGRDAVRPGATFHVLTSSDAAKLSEGDEVILLVTWDEETQRFSAWQDLYTLRVVGGRIVLNGQRAIPGVHGEPVDVAVKTLRTLVQR